MHLLTNITSCFERNHINSSQKNVIKPKKCGSDNYIPTSTLRTIYHKVYKTERDLMEARMIIDVLLRINSLTKDRNNKLCNKLILNPKDTTGFT